MSALSSAGIVASSASTVEPISILISALGGEGGGVLSEWLVDTAQRAGYAAQSTSIPGVAQRTGATTYYLEVFPLPIAQLGGRRPVLSLYPVPGALDLLVSSELLETVRQAGNGLPSPARTHIITSSSRTLTTNERMQIADGRVSSEALIDVVRRASRRHHVLDMTAIAREAGTAVSAAMFGAIAASGAWPFSREQCEDSIRRGGKSSEASLAGFALAFEHLERMRTQAAYVQEVMMPADASPSSSAPIPAVIALRFPKALHSILVLGHARLVEYQDADYAALYLDRMARVVEAEAGIDPSSVQSHAIAAETARYLALWMAFDDIVRVAELKSRATREARVIGEVRAAPNDVVKIYDHFKPGIPEIAALLPEQVARALTSWDARRTKQGRSPWAKPVKLATHSIIGMLALRWLSGLKGMRRRGSRFALEQVLIQRWLGAIERGTRRDWSLGHELALCGRLIKGYGSTNERGKENLLHVVDHLAVQAVDAGLRAQRINDARTAALADESGTAFDRILVASGAPPRAVKTMPIRFQRKAAIAR